MANRPVSNIKFIHCRNLNQDGSIKPHGGMTIAYALNPEFKVIAWAAAKCHQKDTYNKHVGRDKAAGRLLSPKYFQECSPTNEKTFIENAHNGFKKEFS